MPILPAESRARKIARNIATTLPFAAAREARVIVQKFLKTLDGPLSRDYNFWSFFRR